MAVIIVLTIVKTVLKASQFLEGSGGNSGKGSVNMTKLTKAQEKVRQKYINRCPHKYHGCYNRYMLQDCKKCGHHKGHHLRYSRGCNCGECNENEAKYG